MVRTLSCLFAAVSLSFVPHSIATAAELTDTEQAFVDQLTDVALVGRFSVAGRDTPPKAERYEISKVQKLGGSKWLVTARIKYGQHDIELPVAVDVHWAGDTPVLSVTDIKIPGLGEGFTTRVMFYKDRYAGSWYHGQAGGHMWGKIESAKDAAEPQDHATPPTQN